MLRIAPDVNMLVEARIRARGPATVILAVFGGTGAGISPGFPFVTGNAGLTENAREQIGDRRCRRFGRLL